MRPAEQPAALSARRGDRPDQQLTKAAASEKFVRTTLTIGYPHKEFDVYLARLKPLLTKDGYAEVLGSKSARAKIEKGAKTFYAQRARTSPKFTSGVKVSSITPDTAKTSIDYQNRAQQLSGSKWKTTRTSAEDTATLELVKQDGKWLVDEL